MATISSIQASTASSGPGASADRTDHLGDIGIRGRPEHGQQQIVLRAELAVEGAGRQPGVVEDVLHAGALEAVAPHDVQRGIHQPAPFGPGLGGGRRIEDAPVGNHRGHAGHTIPSRPGLSQPAGVIHPGEVVVRPAAMFEPM